MRKEQGAEQRQFLQEQETIKDFVFTSQSTQTKVDPELDLEVNLDRFLLFILRVIQVQLLFQQTVQ